MTPSTIMAISQLPENEKREIFTRLIPEDLQERFDLSPYFVDKAGNDLVELYCPPGSSSAELALYHQAGFPDPILYGEMADTMTGHFHILLYVLNDPYSPRFDVDRLPNGTPTNFGTEHRNIEAELAAMNAGLAPGQIRFGLRLLSTAVESFESFLSSLEHELYFVEPLYYHNAVNFERYGLAYQKGRRRMEAINEGFKPGGAYRARLDGSNPFRMPEAADSIRLRSWAIHDGIMGEPYTDITMYKEIHKHAGVKTCTGCTW